MSLPLATTRITVRRSDQDGTKDAFDGVTFTDYRTGIRAVIGSISGSETATSGESSTVTARLDCDPVDLRHSDQVYDEQTGLTWEVTFTAERTGFGLDHTVADLLLVVDRTAVT